MTITTDQTRSATPGNGTTTAFATPFQFFDAADIRVTLVVTAGGAKTLQTIATHYTVAGGNSGSGPATGTVTMLIPPTTLQTLVVELIDAFTQPEIYLRGGKFPARSIEDGLDRANLHIQELRDIVGRAPRLPITDAPATPSAPSLPDPVADEFLVGNAAGDGWEGKTAVVLGALTVPLTIANGGTNATSAAAARTSLGLAIGSDVQAWDDDLDDLAALTPTNSNFIVGDGTDWVAESGATVRTSLGLVIGTNVQAWDAQLDDIAALAPTADNFIAGDGANWVLKTPATARTSLGLVIGTNVQAFDAGLTDIAALATTADNFIAGDGANWVLKTPATARTSLGLVVGTNVQAQDAGLDDIAALAVTDSNIIVGDGSNWVAETGATARTSLGAQEDVVTTRGDVVRGSATGVAERLALGASGQVLTSDGTDAAWAAAGGGLTLATEQATTSGTSIDFTSIPAGTKRITIQLVGVSTSGTNGVIVQIGDAGGIEATGYLSAHSEVAGGAFPLNGNQTTGYIIFNSAAAAIHHGTIVLTLEDSANFTWVSSSTLGRSDNTTVDISAGSKSLSAELDRIRLTTITGTDTFDAGAMNILFE